MAKPANDPEKDWTRWADRAVERGAKEAARAARFLDAADPRHPNLKGVSPETLTALRERLHAAAKGA